MEGQLEDLKGLADRAEIEGSAAEVEAAMPLRRRRRPQLSHWLGQTPAQLGLAPPPTSRRPRRLRSSPSSLRPSLRGSLAYSLAALGKTKFFTLAPWLSDVGNLNIKHNILKLSYN